MCTRRRCCYGMPAAALLVRQGNESRVAYRFLPPNSVQVVAHIFAVSPFSTFDSRPSTASERITAWREGLPLTVSAKFRSTDRSPSPPPDITTVATEQAPPAGLPPARTSASIAARHRNLCTFLCKPKTNGFAYPCAPARHKRYFALKLHCMAPVLPRNHHCGPLNVNDHGIVLFWNCTWRCITAAPEGSRSS